MNLRIPKSYFLVLLALIAILLAGCEKVSDARSEFCDSLGEVGELATDFKNAKIDDPVDEFKSKVERLQDRKKNLDRLAKLTDVPVLDKFAAAVDNVAEAVNTVTGNTLGPAVDKIQTAGAGLESAYQDLDDAVCAAK
jgi:Sec-independent protein translocase protein TatA